MSGRNYRKISLCLSLLILTCLGLPAQDAGNAGFVAGSAVPLVPMTGDGLQMFSQAYHSNYVRICPEGSKVADCDQSGAPNNTMTAAGVRGSDEGSTATTPDGIPIFLFGDTHLVWWDKGSGKPIFFNPTVKGPDAMAYFDQSAAGLDWSQCHYIENLDKALSAGKDAKTASAANCPALTFYQRNGKEPPPPAVFQDDDHLKGLGTSIGRYRENYGPMATPTGAFFLGNDAYEFYQDIPEIMNNRQRCRPILHLNSILAKSTGSYSGWGKTTPPVFRKLYDVSQHGVVNNCQSREDAQQDEPGKFIFAAPVVMSRGTVQSLGAINSLPQPIRDAGNVIFVFGSSWYYRRSNLYLAVVADRDIEKGPGKWWYLTGMRNGAPEWKQGKTPVQSNDAEIGAAPLLTSWSNRLHTPSIGEHSVRYVKELGEFVLMYGKPEAGGLFARTAKLPWGPWSPEALMFASNGEWASKISGRPEGNSITQSWPPVSDSSSARNPHAFEDRGAGPYGPNIIENKYTVNSDHTVTLYYTTSFFVPYEVFLMKATFAMPK